MVYITSIYRCRTLRPAFDCTYLAEEALNWAGQMKEQETEDNSLHASSHLVRVLPGNRVNWSCREARPRTELCIVCMQCLKTELVTSPMACVAWQLTSRKGGYAYTCLGR